MRTLVLLATLALATTAYAGGSGAGCDYGASTRTSDAADILKADGLVADATATPAATPAPKPPAK